MKQFDPSAFIELAQPQAKAQGMTVAHHKPDTENCVTEHIWLGTDNYVHVIALTDKDGVWFSVAESQNYDVNHLANVLRRVAYTRTTGKFLPLPDKD